MKSINGNIATKDTTSSVMSLSSRAPSSDLAVCVPEKTSRSVDVKYFRRRATLHREMWRYHRRWRLNCCVRYGNRCGLPFVWKSSFLPTSKLHNAFPLFRSSPRPLVPVSLGITAHTHLAIYLIIYKGLTSLTLWESHLKVGSRLDAFSAYPVRTWSSNHAPGGTTGIPAVRHPGPRTRDSPRKLLRPRQIGQNCLTTF